MFFFLKFLVESFLIDFFGKSGYFSSFNLEDSLVLLLIEFSGSFGFKSEIFGSFNLESSKRSGIRLGVHIFYLRPTVAILILQDGDELLTHTTFNPPISILIFDSNLLKLELLSIYYG
ncbi:unnamed protein product [Rhizophagus irregularis]|nr:unnamed protein product [Rhizophagus irregularis]CAB5374288.1 unnamed protein product [Rhizophagus irregularis]